MSRWHLILSAMVAAVLVAGCSGDETSGESTTTADTTGQSTVVTESTPEITLRVARTNTGPWEKSVSLKLTDNGVPVQFFVCGLPGETPPRSRCVAPGGAELPTGTLIRLEQRPIGPAAPNADSPGWGTVGSSDQPELEIVLSSFVSGNRTGPITYRATLRTETGRVLSTSNPVVVTWRK